MIDLVALHRILDDYFSLEELKQFCFELGVDADDLEAIGQRGKARELLKRLEREGRVEDAVTLLAQKRPSLNLDHLHIFSYRDRLRPAPPGSSISHYRSGAATLGCLVADRDDPRRIYILCDASGVYPAGVAPQSGDPIIQPGQADGGNAAADTIARLARRASLTDDPAATTNVSAALAEVTSLTAVTPQLHQGGFFQGVAEAKVGVTVWGNGRSAANVQGTIQQIGVAYTLPWPAAQVEAATPADAGGNVAIPFTDLIVTTPMLQSGDSGMVLRDGRHRAVGLGFAGNERISLFIPLQKALDILNVTLVGEDEWRDVATP